MMIDDANPYVESNFSWAEWTPNTTLKLCRVPWDASYRDIVRFVSRETQREWFNKLDGVECRPATMHIFNAPARVELPFNEASNWNYLVAYNDYPGLEGPRAWYYFIQRVEYVNAHCTQLVLMLDVWQSFQHDVTFGSCYVTRGHIGVANEHQWDDYGRTYLALPEGLDTGSEMVTTAQEYQSIIEGQHYDIDGGVDWVDYGLIVVSTTNLTDDPGNTSAPKLTTATGAIFEQETDGCSVYYCENRMAYVANIMALGALFPWVTQGICAVYMVPKIPQDYVSRYGNRVTEIYGQSVSEEYGNIYSFNSSLDSDLRYEDVMAIANFRNKFNIPARYRNLRKLCCYPFCVIECSCLNGTVITYRPEDIQSDTLTIRETYTYAPSGARINFYIPGYNEAGASTIVPLRINGKDMGLPIDGGEMLNASFGITNLPHFSVVNNGGALAMVNSAYTRAYAQESAQWTRQKALTSANVANSNAALQREYATRQTNWANENRTATNAITANSLNQSLAIGQNQTSQMANLQVEQNIKSNNLNGMASIIGGGLNAVASCNPLGVVNAVGGAFLGSAQTDIANYGINSSAAVSNSTAAANTANQIATNAAATSQANAYTSGATALGNQLNAIVSQANYGLASYAAQGDYQNAIAGINAQVQQMQLTPPTTSGALGGDMFNLSNGIMGVLVRFKTCAPSALRAAGEYMLRYGYFVQRFVTPPASLECMEKFTFWQMQEAYVRGTLPEEYRLTIKGMFERGVTVWNKPEYIGVTDWADNEPLPGIGYE
jgi:hypothetical protein